MNKIDFVDVGVAIKKHFGNRITMNCINNEIRCYIEGQGYSIAFWNDSQFSKDKYGISVSKFGNGFLSGDERSQRIGDILKKELGLDG